MSTANLIDAETMLHGTRDPKQVALWTGYRLGVLGAIAPETFAGLLERDVDVRDELRADRPLSGGIDTA